MIIIYIYSRGYIFIHSLVFLLSLVIRSFSLLKLLGRSTSPDRSGLLGRSTSGFCLRLLRGLFDCCLGTFARKVHRSPKLGRNAETGLGNRNLFFFWGGLAHFCWTLNGKMYSHMIHELYVSTLAIRKNMLL